MSDIEYLEAENNELRQRLEELEAQVERLSLLRSPLSKEEAKLLGMIHKCKIELKRQPLKKTGYNNHNKYSYFELGDFLPCLEVILDNHGLGSYCYFEDGVGYLVIFDVESGVFHSWDTPCRLPQVKENGFDVGVYMKAEQAVQTYARRTLYLQAFDIVEPNSIESDGEGKSVPQKSKVKPKKQPKQVSPVNPVVEKKDTEVTAERVNSILDEAYKRFNSLQLKKLKKDRLPFTWENAQTIINDLCGNAQEFNACSQSIRFDTANKV